MIVILSNYTKVRFYFNKPKLINKTMGVSILIYLNILNINIKNLYLYHFG